MLKDTESRHKDNILVAWELRGDSVSTRMVGI